MEIPTSRGLFTPESISLHKDDQPITPGMIENIGAMLNPKETLLNYQHAQAAKTMANITLDGLLPEVKAKFGKEMNDYIQDYQDLLAKSSSVGGRIALNYGDRIKMEARQKEIQEKVDWAEQSVKDLGPTVTEFANKISGEGMRQFTDDWKDKVVNAKTAGDIPNPRMFIMQGGYEEKYPKTKPEDEIKGANEFTTFTKDTLETVVHGFENTKGELTTENKEAIARNVDALPPKTLALLGGKDKPLDKQKQAIYQMALDYRKKGDPNTLGWFNAMLREQHYDDKQAEKAKGGINIEAQYDVGNKTKTWPVGTYNIPYTGKVYDAENSKWVTGKGKIEEVIDRNGGKELKVSITDPDNKERIITGHAPYETDIKTKLKGVGKGVNLQDFDTDTFDSKGEQGKHAPTKLSGKIDPSTLVKDQQYDVNGVIYKWNGTKLVK